MPYSTLVALALFGSPSPEPPSLERLAWLAGSWRGEEGGVEMEEHWTRPAGGIMVGMHRDVSSAGRVLFEFLRIEQNADGIVYLASPRGRPATPFTLTELGENRATFANPEHDFPKRVRYWLDGDGRLHARIEGDAEDQAREWIWQRSTLAD